MSAQGAFAQALLDPHQSVPPGIVTWNQSDPARRLAVYRNNVMVSLVDALAQTFPVTRTLVGEEFFRAMCQVFVRENPPRLRVLSRYGDELPGFIRQFTPAAGLPYLADVARLEMLRLQALHAADAPAMAPHDIAAIVQDPQRLPVVRWLLAPSLRIFCSPHAAASLWAAHQDGSGLPIGDIDLQQAETALVFRRELDVIVWQPPPGVAELVDSLAQGLPLDTACERAFDAAPDFDLPLSLASLMRHELLTGADFPH
ncbi:MAG: DNA-binding domain-containing protein [Polaromonas sp.]